MSAVLEALRRDGFDRRVQHTEAGPLAALEALDLGGPEATILAAPAERGGSGLNVGFVVLLADEVVIALRRPLANGVQYESFVERYRWSDLTGAVPSGGAYSDVVRLTTTDGRSVGFATGRGYGRRLCDAATARIRAWRGEGSTRVVVDLPAELALRLQRVADQRMHSLAAEVVDQLIKAQHATV